MEILKRDQMGTMGYANGGANTSPHIMRVKKRDGTLEPVDVTKIVERVNRCCQGLASVDPLRVATKAINGLYDGASTKELDNLCIQTASLLIGEDPEYSRLAARLLSTYIDEEVKSQKIGSFADSIKVYYLKRHMISSCNTKPNFVPLSNITKQIVLNISALEQSMIVIY